MREYIFRAKYKETGEWWHGFGVHKVDYTDGTTSYHLYTDNGVLAVDPETVGQYTGLQDRNGKDIYEGDILLDQRFDSGTGEVYFDPELAVWKVRFQQEDWLSEFHDCSEVIGNRFDNPELLGEVRE